MWPFICQFIEKLFRETIEPAVRGANTHLSTFSFTRIDMGQQVSFFLSIFTCVHGTFLSIFTVKTKKICETTPSYYFLENIAP